MKRRLAMDFLLPLALLSIFTAVFAYSNLDLELQQLFYTEGQGWTHGNTDPWLFLYKYGTLPALAMAIIAFIMLAASFWSHKLLAYRKQAIFIILAILIGPGLVVNLVFKDHWGRPRPREISQFDGAKEFYKVWQKGDSGSDYAFPSGHAAMGFFLLAPYFTLRSHSRKWAVAFLVTGLVYGSMMGLGRMIQGQHFASDVIWAGGFVYLSAAACYYLLGLYRTGREPTQSIGHWRPTDSRQKL